MKSTCSCIHRVACVLCALAAITGCAKTSPSEVAGGDSARGKLAIQAHGCVACHAIPGIPGPGSNVGPTLNGIAKRAYIAGVLANTPESMVRWLRDPLAVDPRTAMPATGLTEAQAKDIAAYLNTLE